jgi:hypothetical protein
VWIFAAAIHKRYSPMPMLVKRLMEQRHALSISICRPAILLQQARAVASSCRTASLARPVFSSAVEIFACALETTSTKEAALPRAGVAREIAPDGICHAARRAAIGTVELSSLKERSRVKGVLRGSGPVPGHA